MNDARNKIRATPVKLGITGSIGSGKSEVCRRFEYLGVSVISADDLAREAVLPGKRAYDQIVSLYGARVVLPDGNLDRRMLRRMMADDPEVKKDLEAIIHPEVFLEMEAWISKQAEFGKPLVAIEVPLLFEAGLEQFFDYTIAVVADETIRARRVAVRDGVCEADALEISRLQMPDSKKAALADFVIENSGSIDDLHAKVDEVYHKIKSRAMQAR